ATSTAAKRAQALDRRTGPRRACGSKRREGTRPRGAPTRLCVLSMDVFLSRLGRAGVAAGLRCPMGTTATQAPASRFVARATIRHREREPWILGRPRRPGGLPSGDGPVVPPRGFGQRSVVTDGDVSVADLDDPLALE